MTLRGQLVLVTGAGRSGTSTVTGALARLVDAEVRATDVEKLQTWLGEQFDGVDRVVVKDPRAAVLTGLWADAAARVGVDIGYVAMLRYPSEVIGSRAAYYEPGATPSLAQASDAFVEPSLRRHRPTWEGIDLPRSLRVVVEDAWSALARLSGSVSRDRAAEDDLDEIAARFARLYAAGFHEGTPNPADDARAAEESAPAGSLVGRRRRGIRRGRSS